LLLSTLRDIFLGKKDLFKGLWIEDKIDWKPHQVIHLSFGKSDFREIGLRRAIELKLAQVAKANKISLENESFVNQFEELILKMASHGQVVILIDEYDKPIIEYLSKEEIAQAIENRNILKSFYSVIKDLDKYIRFLFITGVSKFSKVSIFSELNNLLDISLHSNYAELLGYTQPEMEHYFAKYMKYVANKLSLNIENLKNELKQWYNGYDFSGMGNETVYNPFSILSFMESGQFGNYWFSTGTPTFLIKMLKEKGMYNIESETASEITLSNFKIEDLDVTTLLFQTGYLTIQSKIAFDTYILTYPNREVKNSMLQMLLAEFAHLNSGKAQPLVIKLRQALTNTDIKEAVKQINSLLAQIPYDIFEADLESYYHSIIFLTFTLLGYYADAEVHTSEGRIDAVVKTDTHIFILEFKINDTAESALQQIKDRHYADRYLNEGKQICLVGMACKEKTIKDYLVENI
jgi:Predicted AAA-ATPase/PD-(D/E)XK nuclease superfamily